MLFDRWGGQADSVFSELEGDFMKPRINEVINNQLREIIVNTQILKLKISCTQYIKM